jgi:uncharacterized protein YukE
MGDEYMDRYGRIAHAELDRQLGAGSPAGVDAVADAWRSVEDTVGSLGVNLRRGLAALRASWSGAGSDEYQRRVGLIATLAEGLAKEAQAMRTGLSLMSSQLAEAQRSAEPDPGPATDWAFDGVLGPALGRTVTAAQRSAAQQKMAKLVSQTALAYRLADHRHWPKTLPPVPADLPGGSLEHHALDHDDRGHDDRHSWHTSEHDHDHHHGVTSGIHAGHHPVTAAAAAAPGPGEPVRSVLAGANAVAGPAATAGLGAGVAGATVTGHLVGHGPAHGDAPDVTASGAAPPMGGAGITTAPAGIGGGGVAPPGAAPAGHFRPADGATSWSTGEKTPWLEDDIDPPPPAVIGPTVH